MERISCEDCHHAAVFASDWPCRVCRGDSKQALQRANDDTYRSHFILGYNPLRAAVQAVTEKEKSMFDCPSCGNPCHPDYLEYDEYGASCPHCGETIKEEK